MVAWIWSIATNLSVYNKSAIIRLTASRGGDRAEHVKNSLTRHKSHLDSHYYHYIVMV